ncbi:MAG: hypothetical protein RH942_14795 [Kiloniellaceae bacterium]
MSERIKARPSTGMPLRRRPAAWSLLLILAGVVAGCAEMKPLDYAATDEIKPGPGLLTGEDGEFVLYGSSRKSVLN